MKTLKTIFLIPLLGLLAMPAIAGHGYGYGDDGRHHRYEHRQERQHDRIRHGIRNGELTRKEAKRLLKQQRRIAKLEHRFELDGHLDRAERRTLRRKLDAASQRIYRLKHNDRYREHRYRGRDGHAGHRRHDRRYDAYDSLRDGGWSVGLVLWDRL